MYREVLAQFDKPWLPITALVIFLVCFIAFVYWTFKKENKIFYDESAKIPFNE